MSKILNDIATDSISLTECLQRLLIIANKTGNTELSEWCTKELTGYKSKEGLPDYRKFKSRNIVYSGINGRYQITNQPMQPGYLSEKTIKIIEDVFLVESISEVEKRKDADDHQLARDLTTLAGEVYKRTKDEDFGIGVQCTSIQQIIPAQFYGEIFSAVKTRVINLLCYYEEKGVNLDSLDISKNKENKEENAQVFNKIVIEGNTYTPQKEEKKIMWNIIVPIITGVAGGIISGVLVYLITNVWFK